LAVGANMSVSISNIGTGLDGEHYAPFNRTSLQLCVDRRLYVAKQNGSIDASSVSPQDGVYVASGKELLVDGDGGKIIKDIQNDFCHSCERSSGFAGLSLVDRRPTHLFASRRQRAASSRLTCECTDTDILAGA
jgi:hypothetical protein